MKGIFALIVLLSVLCSVLSAKMKLQLQKARASSSYGSYPAAYALNGQTSNGRVPWGKCANTVGGGSQQWWSAELKHVAVIETVKLYSRQDCCKNRYVDVKVWTGDSCGGNWKLCKDLGNSLQQSKGWVEVECPEHTVGKSVKITQGNNQELALCEVEVYGTALKLPVQQEQQLQKPRASSSYGIYPAEYAINGQTSNGRVPWGKCALTLGGGSQQWWSAELKHVAVIYTIILYSREDCCKNRYVDVKVWTGDSSGGNWKLCKDLGNSLQRSIGLVEVECPDHTVGKSVKVTQGNNQELALCEVEVYGAALKLPAKFQKLQNARASSSYGSYPAAYALNGQTSNGRVPWGKCANTVGGGSQQWWSAELSDVAVINHVKLYSRQDCCKNRYVDVKVWIGDSCGGNWKLCKDLGNTLQHSKGWETIMCPEYTVGKYVKITQGNNQELALCEVEVYTIKLTG